MKMINMRKLLILLSCLLLYGCNPKCILSQIPNQIVYAGVNCTALLPDYKNLFSITGGCTGVTVTQIPEAGTVISTSIDVTIKATGASGKSSQVLFIARLIDNITPVIVSKTTLVEELRKQSQEFYNIGDKLMGQIDSIFEASFPYDSFPGSKPENSFKTKLLVITSRDSLGHRQRVITYVDTLQIPIYNGEINIER